MDIVMFFSYLFGVFIVLFYISIPILIIVLLIYLIRFLKNNK